MAEWAATKTVATFRKERVIELILFVKTLDEDYARFMFVRENALHPDWNLNQAIREAMKAQA